MNLDASLYIAILEFCLSEMNKIIKKTQLFCSLITIQKIDY